MAVNTAMPDAASGSQRCSQTRREASTTSKGAASKPIPEGYGARGHALRLCETSESPMTPSSPSASMSRWSGRARPRSSAVVFAEERRVAGVQTLRTTLEPASGACCSGRFPITGCSTSSKKRRDCERRQIRLVVRLGDLADRHTRLPQPSHHIVGLLVAAPRPPGGRRSRPGRARAPPRWSSSGSAAHAGSPSARRERRHCSSVATAMATQQSSRAFSSGLATW